MTRENRLKSAAAALFKEDSMEEHLIRLVALSKKNVKDCPWCREKSSEACLKELESELGELRTALKKEDRENAKEEMGDVLWDALTLAYKCEKERKFTAKEAVERILKKIENRKPWLIKGERVSKKEAVRIWKERKKREKKREM